MTELQTCSCGQSFMRLRTWFAHRKQQHGEADSHPCPACLEEITDFEKLDLHIKEHVRSEEQAACNVCHEVFKMNTFFNINIIFILFCIST
jgi:tRNA U54 and U55 pseudouridine synthase Pus10